MAEVKERKKKLEKEIQVLESGFEARISNLTKGVGIATNPKKYVKNNPLKSVAIAAAAGFTLGILKRSRKKSRDYSPEKKSNPRSGISSILMNELKHMAVQKAMYYISELVDQQIAGRNQSDSSDK
ncbi:DUF883 C-terminal domain-containing protein [Rhodohalobacter sp.]|uniref:DUF883 C-terminal domain-containing protein n=1 Tax=Rhodohalobacter sp. TaxID=1974210 RepID=UPI002ACD5E13|nr:DUF883 C-terminal domain-containing protein [Rhodohalobacter sp.]MDZ7757139.1 DUF883 C-terminal domain-containing protein [Rhodohalobacter sp.]